MTAQAWFTSRVQGLSELKNQELAHFEKVKFDPVFSLNQSCAMFRAKVFRLLSCTWNTTKRADSLQGHLYIYAATHNETIQKKIKLELCA